MNQDFPGWLAKVTGVPANFHFTAGKFSDGMEGFLGAYWSNGRRPAIRWASLKPYVTQNMESRSHGCAILADRHTLLAEGIRGLLESAFQTVYLVADSPTLREGASRLLPALIVLDLSLAGRDSLRILQQIRDLSPASRVLVLSVHDDAAVARLALSAGAHGVVLKRSIGSDLMPAVDAVLQGEKYVSPGIDLMASSSPPTPVMHPGSSDY